MDYFRILNLSREPFSNSPDPELFYPTSRYLEALHKLEIAIRLRRGLNVVLGDVGTGKTTLSRVLMRTLDEEPERFEVRGILDPSFDTDQEMLAYIIRSFGGRADPWETRQSLMDRLQEMLLQVSLKGQKTMVLSIDEAQKLSDQSLETLRELLNFETNQSKLLQLVLFGQLELWERIRRKKNFLDRVDLLVTLEPLTLSETKAMIQHRLLACGMDPLRPIFTERALRLVYKYTNGHPRKIVALCHHCLLLTIMREKKKVTPECVKMASWELPSLLGQKRPHLSPLMSRWVASGVGVLMVAVAVGMVPGLWGELYHRLWKHGVQELQKEVPEAIQDKTSQIKPPWQSPDVSVQMPLLAASEDPYQLYARPRVYSVLSPREWLDSLPQGITELDSHVTVVVRKGDTLSSLVERHLGWVLDPDSTWIKRFLDANPTVADPNRLRPGETLRLPGARELHRRIYGKLVAWFPALEKASAWAHREMERGKHEVLVVARQEREAIQGFGVFSITQDVAGETSSQLLAIDEGKIIEVLALKNI